MIYKRDIVLSLAAGILLAGSACAEVYRWVDKDGNVHFGDRPGDNPAEQVTIKGAANNTSKAKNASGANTPASASPGSEAQRENQRRENQRRLLRAFEEERRIKRDQAKKQEADAAKKRKNCIQAKDNYRQYKNSGFLYKLDEQGERVYLDKQQYERALQQAREDVTRWCEDH